MNKNAPDTASRTAYVVCEGLIVRAEDQAAVLRVAQRSNLLHWVVSPLDAGANDYLLSPHETPGIAEAWELVYRLRADREVAEAEPAFVTTGMDAQPAQALRARTGGTLGARRRAREPRSAQNDIERMAAYFPEATVSEVRTLLRRALGVSDRQLNDALAEVADELIFHVATDSAVRDKLLAQIKPVKRSASGPEVITMQRVFTHASPLLRSKLIA